MEAACASLALSPCVPLLVTAQADASDHDRLRLRAIAARRRALLRLREDGEIGDEAYHRLEEEVDWAELDAAPAGYFQPLLTDGG